MLEISTLRRLAPGDFERLLDRLGRLEELKAARSIVIKPNLVAANCAKPDGHAMTDRVLLRDIVLAILDINPQAAVHVAESDSSGNAFAYEKLAQLGLPGSLQVPGPDAERVTTCDLSRDRLVRVTNERFTFFISRHRQLWLSETLVNADFVVSVANLKTHLITGLTGACKNLFGCLPDLDKSHYHPWVHDVIHDLTVAISPHLSVVDAFYAMEGNGPVSGRAVDLGYRIFASEATEADLCAARGAGFSAKKVGYLRLLQRTTGLSEPEDCRFPTATKLARPTRFVRATNLAGGSLQALGGRVAAQGLRVRRRERPPSRSTVRRAVAKLRRFLRPSG